MPHILKICGQPVNYLLKVKYKFTKMGDQVMIYLVCGIMVCILSMAGVYTSSANLIWYLIGFAIGFYLIVKGKKRLGFIKQK